MKPWMKLLLISMFIGSLVSCATYTPNTPLERYDPDAGYRLNNLSLSDNSESLFVILTFSGGGTRAAALSYGVLEKLRETRIVWEGYERTLLQEVDVISSVSGGSFTAAYYGLFRDKIFEQFEGRFLYRNIEGELIGLLYYPINWFRLASPTFEAIDMAAEFYDQEIFKGKTYNELVRRSQRPFIMINAADMSIGARFTFVQDQFDLLCSDLGGVRVARAVAASSDFPLFLLSTITLNNYAGNCGYEEPEWIDQALKDRQFNPRRFRRAQIIRSYKSAEERPYIHLLDGGVVDDIGLRGPLEALRSEDSPWNLQEKIQDGVIKKLVVIIVDSETQPPVKFDKSPNQPSPLEVASSLSDALVHNISYDTLDQLSDLFGKWENDANFNIDLYPILVSFENIEDSQEQVYFQTIPTTFYLPANQIDDLRSIAKTLLKGSPDFKKLITDLK